MTGKGAEIKNYLRNKQKNVPAYKLAGNWRCINNAIFVLYVKKNKI